MAIAQGCVIGLLAGCSEASRDPRPSIVLVAVDTLRADAVSAYGAVEGTTPAFDELAAQGLLYTHAFAPSPWTLPSHASLLTGLGVDRHGVGIAGRMGLRADLTTLAERLSQVGYQTVGFSENPLVSGLFGFDQGFDRFAATTIEDVIFEEEHPDHPRFDVVREVAAFAAQRDRGRPFFLFVNLFDPHSPYRNRQPNRFVDPGVSVADLWTPAALKVSPNRICSRLPAPHALEVLHGLYLGDVAAADAKLGKISTLAREAARKGPLIVVATADHGEHFGEHRLLDHEFSVRAPVLHIPLAIQGVPDVPTARIDAAVTLVDVTASVLSWAGVEIPAEIAGRPLPVRAGDAQPPEDLLAVYSDAKLHAPEGWKEGLEPAENARDVKRSGCSPSDRVFGNMAALTRWPFKLIWFANYPAELYDLSWDPLERSDLASLRPDVRDPMVAEVQQRIEDLGLSEPKAGVETPSDAERETLRGLGYVE